MSNQLTNLENNNNLKMTSREIAELTGKEHRNVKRDISVMLDQLDLDTLNYEQTYLDSVNREQTEYALDRELTEVLVTGYSPKLRLAVIRRLKELEQQVTQLPNFNDPVEAARAWANEVEQKQAIQFQLKVAEPKINHYDTVVERTGLVLATNIGNKLGISATKLNRLLDDLDVYNKRTKKRAFKQWFIDKGLGIAKQANMGFNQCLFTLKGEAWIVEQLTLNKAVPEADIERIEARANQTEAAKSRIESLLAS